MEIMEGGVSSGVLGAANAKKETIVTNAARFSE